MVLITIKSRLLDIFWAIDPSESSEEASTSIPRNTSKHIKITKEINYIINFHIIEDFFFLI